MAATDFEPDGSPHVGPITSKSSALAAAPSDQTLVDRITRPTSLSEALPGHLGWRSMALLIEVPDGVAERLAAAAASRGITAAELAVKMVADQLAADESNSRPASALTAFIGSVEGPGTRFDTRAARRDLAARRSARGTRDL